MNLADMLGYADIGQLSRIAVEYQCECNGNSKNELIQTILSAVSRRETFEEQVGRLGLEDLRFLNSLLFDTRSSFSMEDLTARIQQSKFGEEQTRTAGSVAEVQPPESIKTGKTKRAQAAKKRSKTSNPVKEITPRDIILKFKHQGWLFNGLTGPSRYMFHVPADLKTRLRDTLERKMSIMVDAAEEPHAYREEQGLLSEDLYHMLQYVRRYEVPTSSDGSMYKRNLIQLMEHMGVRESLPQKGEWRFGYGRKFHVYPNRLALLYDFAMDSKLIVEASDCVMLTQIGEDKLSEPQLDETSKLYRYWLKLYKNPIPNLLALVNWIDRLARNWVTADSLQRTLLPYVKPYYYDTSESIFAQRIVGMMLHLGLVRIGEHEKYGTVIRMTKLGSAVVGSTYKEEAVPAR